MEAEIGFGWEDPLIHSQYRHLESENKILTKEKERLKFFLAEKKFVNQLKLNFLPIHSMFQIIYESIGCNI